jgi:hypothetical protein
MVRHDTLSWRPAKEQPPADMRDDKTVNTTEKVDKKKRLW